MNKPALEIIPALDRPEEVRQLFAEYTRFLIDGDSDFAGYLRQQNYEAELADLSRKYGPPKGRLYLAFYDGKLAGCGGIRGMDEARCELKRFYVRPSFRRLGIARAILNLLVSDARQIGYSEIVLDTLPYLPEAQQLYRSHGFKEIAPFVNSPMKGTVYLGLKLE